MPCEARGGLLQGAPPSKRQAQGWPRTLAPSCPSPAPLFSRRSAGFRSPVSSGDTFGSPWPCRGTPLPRPPLNEHKIFPCCNYLVHLCCCGQRLLWENPPGAAAEPVGEGGVPRPGPPRLIHPTAGPGPATRTPRRRRRCPIATGPGAISTFPGLDSHVPSTTPTPLRQEHEPFRGFAPQDVAKLPSTRLLEHPHAQIRAEDAFWAGGDLDSPPTHTRFRSADSHQRRGEMVWELTWRHARASASRRHPAGKSPAGGWRRAGPRSGPAQLPPGPIPTPVPPPTPLRAGTGGGFTARRPLP